MLSLYSIVIPARDEQDSLPDTLSSIHTTLRDRQIPHEIVVVDDGSRDDTWGVLQSLKKSIPVLRPLFNPGRNGFGRAIVLGLDNICGDAVTIMMADASDSPEHAAEYWRLLNEGHDAVFGSRFMKGSEVVDYPKMKLFCNRLANRFIQLLFAIRLNDTTNAFKAYRKTTIDGLRPLLSPHFNLTVELPLKTIVRGYRWTIMPISWHNRQHGVAKLKIKEMGSRYLFIILYVWLEKYFSRGDFLKGKSPPSTFNPQPAPSVSATHDR